MQIKIWILVVAGIALLAIGYFIGKAGKAKATETSEKAPDKELVKNGTETNKEGLDLKKTREKSITAMV